MEKHRGRGEVFEASSPPGGRGAGRIPIGCSESRRAPIPCRPVAMTPAGRFSIHFRCQPSGAVLYPSRSIVTTTPSRPRHSQCLVRARGRLYRASLPSGRFWWSVPRLCRRRPSVPLPVRRRSFPPCAASFVALPGWAVDRYVARGCRREAFFSIGGTWCSLPLPSGSCSHAWPARPGTRGFRNPRGVTLDASASLLGSPRNR